jgi:hypothetical protein
MEVRDLGDNETCKLNAVDPEARVAAGLGTRGLGCTGKISMLSGPVVTTHAVTVRQAPPDERVGIGAAYAGASRASMR